MASAGRDPDAELTAAITQRLKNAWASSRLHRAIFIAGAAAMAGVAQFWNWPSGANPTIAQLVGIGGTAVVFLGAIVSIRGDKDASEELRIAYEARAELNRDKERLDDLIRLWPNTDRMIALYNAISLMRDAIEHATVARVGDEASLTGTLLQVAGAQLALAAGFNLADQYTISIYKAFRAKDGCRMELRLVEHLRPIDNGKDKARIWPEGQGVAGVAFSKRSEIVVEDLASDAAKSAFGSATLERAYDDDRYRSIVAVPVLVERDGDLPWGIVAATNDRESHFNHDQEPGLKHEEAIRALAKYVALAVALVGAVDGGSVPVEVA
jgi:hypothetical protein